MIERHIDINRFDYDLPDGRIAKFPLPERSSSKLLVYRGGRASPEAHFARHGRTCCPREQLLVFNNTKVIRARIIMLQAFRGRGSRFSASSPTTRPTTSGRSPSREPANGRCIVGQPQEMEGGRTWTSISRHEGRPEHLTGMDCQPEPTAANTPCEFSNGTAAMTFGQLLEVPRPDPDSALPEPRERS